MNLTLNYFFKNKIQSLSIEAKLKLIFYSIR